MKIGIYGGTFNPPHLGHMAAAQAAMAVLGLDKLFFIPAALPPHKELPADGAGAEHRLAMTALMADGLGESIGRRGDVEALDIELRRTGKSYTADTLEELHSRFPEDELWLLMGTDMFLTIQNWYQPERIMASCCGSRPTTWPKPTRPGCSWWSCPKSPISPPLRCGSFWRRGRAATGSGRRCTAIFCATGCTVSTPT